MRKLIETARQSETMDEPAACAYCGKEGVTRLNEFKREERPDGHVVLTFFVDCGACGKDDWVSVLEQRFLKVLTYL